MPSTERGLSFQAFGGRTRPDQSELGVQSGVRFPCSSDALCLAAGADFKELQDNFLYVKTQLDKAWQRHLLVTFYYI